MKTYKVRVYDPDEDEEHLLFIDATDQLDAISKIADGWILLGIRLEKP